MDNRYIYITYQHIYQHHTFCMNFYIVCKRMAQHNQTIRGIDRRRILALSHYILQRIFNQVVGILVAYNVILKLN